jgi:hypothetical protein
MPNPAAVVDSYGEWFEIYNSLPDTSVDVNGWTIRDQGSDHHVVDNGGPLLVPPMSYIVLGRNLDSALNGGVKVDYQYTSFALANSNDEIELVDSLGTVIDMIAYAGSAAFDGASASLRGDSFDAAGNDLAFSWCPATTALPGGDRGTPGAANDPCN